MQKKRIGEYNRKMLATGGGPPPEEPSTLYLNIEELLPSQFTAICNPYDSDRPTPRNQETSPLPQCSSQPDIQGERARVFI